MHKISGKFLIKLLSKKGFKIHSRKGSHVKLTSKKRNTKTIVPLHSELSPGTLNAIIKQSKLTKNEKKELFGKRK